MATHNDHRHRRITRRDRTIERLVEWLTRLIEAWIGFWHSTEPGQHSEGATDRYADLVHDTAAEIAAIHDNDSDEPGLYRLLMDATTISGTGLAEMTTVDGWSLTGNLLDSIPGA